MILQTSTPSIDVLGNASQIWELTYKSINDLLAAAIQQLPLIIAGMLVLLLFWVIAKIVRKVFWAASGKTRLDNRLRILFSRLIVIGVFVLGIFTAFTVIVPSFRFGDLIAALGFTSFIVGFATKDILNNLLSGVLILWKQPFHIGDYIFIKDKQGKVEYIGVRATTLRMDDGEKILMPNGEMYSNALTIRGAGAERRMKLQFSIGYDAEIGKAKSDILRVVDESNGVLKAPSPSVFVTDLASEGVNLSVYFWINTNDSSPMSVIDEVATRIKKAMNKSEIELYPPSSVIVQNAAEIAASADNGRKEEDL